ncbi:MAG: hypothetical protein ABI547_02750 [Betaproteobacteria bacterium]
MDRNAAAASIGEFSSSKHSTGLTRVNFSRFGKVFTKMRTARMRIGNLNDPFHYPRLYRQPGNTVNRMVFDENFLRSRGFFVPWAAAVPALPADRQKIDSPPRSP